MTDDSMAPVIETLIQQERLPSSYEQTVRQTILPLAERIIALRQKQGRPVVVGIHGAQGTGKSTLTLFLKEILHRQHQCASAGLSLDDLYLTRAERQTLARTVHPLLQTRGVPGTHDVELGLAILERLTTAGRDDVTAIPAFDKASDDRMPEADWPVFKGRADVVLFEGWCVGALPEEPEALSRPVNRLEEEEDRDGAWRGYVNDCLKGPYRTLFGRLDLLVMLQAPSMDCVREWRTLQEHKLAERHRRAPEGGGHSGDAPSMRIMTDDEVIRFIMHYQRVTEHCLREMPARADVLVPVSADHSLGAPQFRDAPEPD
ncbi:hypothetical protein ACFQGA_14440 [Marinobacter koreensis]|uniref:D-glycerate 3-kinase n=1 Tax=Marinobacter koreensis TaxID=335974 RepID=A0ABW0RMY4_9GAMM|nr:hypothetical protein [Marinobacter koreensis]